MLMSVVLLAGAALADDAPMLPSPSSDSVVAEGLDAAVLGTSAASASATSPSAADAGSAPLELYLRLGTRWITDPRFDALADSDTLFRPEIGVGYAPGWLDDRLTLELGYAVSSVSTSLFDVMQSSFTLHAIQGAAAYAIPVHRFGTVTARAGASLLFASVSLEEDGAYSNRPPLSGADTLFGLQGVLGYELALPLEVGGAPSGPRLGLSAEAGYEVVPTHANFDDVRRDVKDPTSPRRIPASPVDAGRLDLSGWILRFGGSLRF
ncbi:hypothetical protein AKJ08_0905 [Vulgatibacter incomptus]|uniref:Outer membrane protein beta-barrel domain-containing protein n=1 Tax=Vulgatibacter incomptus TaxID=1391653 RepID=A0A0K1PAF5_9BACT|nr:hypothetical protein AKJ08_0905 [Vulgatibacter incomptus]